MDTKSAILDAAARLFARDGFAATSIRSIVAEAGVNLAAIHYHFGTREGLILAVIDRQITPMNNKRLAMLDEFEAGSKTGKASLEQVLRAMVLPPLIHLRESKKDSQILMKLIGRIMSEPDESRQKMLEAKFGETIQRFIEAFSRACPHLPKEDLLWRIHFAIGAMAHTMCDSNRIAVVSKGICDPNDTERIITQLVAFLAAGFKAKPITNPKGS